MMLYDTPLRKCHAAYAHDAGARQTDESARRDRPGAAIGARGGGSVEYVSYGPPDAGGLVQCEVPATFGEVEIEYAAIRRGVGLLDAPHRGVLRVTGDDRRAFLNSMLTQQLADLAPGQARESFWLNRKGRIEADLLLAELGGEILVDLDVHNAAGTVRTLGSFLFAEAVEVVDGTPAHHRMSAHGPGAVDLLRAAADAGGAPDAIAALDRPLGAGTVTIGGADVVAVRRDQTGACGLELFVPRERATDVWEALLAAGEDRRARPIGWYAYNIARIEAGTPLYNIDFGPTNLPNESGLLDERVSFTKGCYLGQELVARLANLGQPKQTLVGLRMSDDLLPVAGGQVFEAAEGAMGDQIGSVTSSTLSPMLGAAAVAFAMIKSSSAGEGTTVIVNAEGAQGEATVSGLRFLA